MAEASGIALTFMDDGMRDRIRLDSIMCVRQVAFADMP